MVDLLREFLQNEITLFTRGLVLAGVIAITWLLLSLIFFSIRKTQVLRQNELSTLCPFVGLSLLRLSNDRFRYHCLVV